MGVIIVMFPLPGYIAKLIQGVQVTKMKKASLYLSPTNSEFNIIHHRRTRVCRLLLSVRPCIPSILCRDIIFTLFPSTSSDGRHPHDQGTRYRFLRLCALTVII